MDDKGNDINVNGKSIVNPTDSSKYQDSVNLYNYYGGTSMDAKATMILVAGPSALGGQGTVVWKTEGVANVENPLINIRYTDKVRSQATQGDYHGFRESVDGFGANGKVTQIIGGDNVARTKVEIPGGYQGKSGVFEYIIEPDGITCNHRLFVPN